MVDYKDIGGRIRAVRMERGMTQAQLADCSEQEVKLISDMVIDLKGSLWRLDLTGSKE